MVNSLYVFGSSPGDQFPIPGPVALNAAVTNAFSLDLMAPTLTIHAACPLITIMWASWCDLILRFEDGNIIYYGTSLTYVQADCVRKLSTLDSASDKPVFFGRRDTSGVLGYILPTECTITIFHTAEELAQGADEAHTYTFANEMWDVLGIEFTSSAGVFINAKTRACKSRRGGIVVELPSLKHFEGSLRTEYFDRFLDRKQSMALPLYHTERCSFTPLQWCTNSAALTALNDEGEVYTYATDRRFPRALGRDFERPINPIWQDRAIRIAYLEHTKIVKVAAGGLYTAAVSDDGELYVWGQVMGDMAGELALLQSKYEGDDEYVRVMSFRTPQGAVLKVTDVAVGASFILVAVEREETGKDLYMSRAVFAAGNNQKGSLGLGFDPAEVPFLEKFAEIEAFRGKKIKQMVCAGWSSYVVVEDTPG